MFCPKCSQEQVSDEVRFCSRCGFSLSAVRELVAGGGGAEAQSGQLSRSQRGVRRGAWMMLASLALMLITGLLAAMDDVFAVFLVVPFLCFVIGFAWVLYGVFFADKRTTPVKGAASHVPILPEQRSSAAHSPELFQPRVVRLERLTAQRVETAEMVEPPSVTENTTRFFDEDSDPRRG